MRVRSTFPYLLMRCDARCLATRLRCGRPSATQLYSTLPFPTPTSVVRRTGLAASPPCHPSYARVEGVKGRSGAREGLCHRRLCSALVLLGFLLHPSFVSSPLCTNLAHFVNKRRRRRLLHTPVTIGAKRGGVFHPSFRSYQKGAGGLGEGRGERSTAHPCRGPRCWVEISRRAWLDPGL